MDIPRFAAKVPLIGSDPQVKWAKTIRLRKAQAIQKMGIRVLLLGVKPHITEQDMIEMRCETKKHILSMVHGVCQHMVSCRSAKWWIDHRDDPEHLMIGPSVKACIEHWKKTKPFK